MRQELRHKDFADRPINKPLDVGIILERNEDGGVKTNVPHLVTHHSPAGFEWGYGGSGPADLALNILEAVLSFLEHEGERVGCWDGDCFAEAWRLHQAFKWEKIASVDHAGAVIPYATVEAWAQERLAND